MISEKWHILTKAELDRCEACLAELHNVIWAKPLLTQSHKFKWWPSKPKRSTFAETNFAFELL